MDLETVNALACCLDDVYSVTNDASRKVTSKLNGNMMTITFQTIANFARESYMHQETANLKKEAASIINDKVKSVKKTFKERAGRTLTLTKEKEYDNFETISVSSFSPVRVVKYTFNVCYEVK